MTLLRRYPLLGALMLALMLRLGWSLAIPVSPISDASVYDIFARQIASGHGYVWPSGKPTAYWAVGASALYGAFYAFLGVATSSIVAANLLFGLIFVGATYWLASNRFGRDTAVIAAVIAAVWPVWIQLTTILTSELPFVALIVVALALRSESRWPFALRVALSTVSLVAAVFVRPIALPLLVAWPIAECIGHRDWRRGAIDLALSLAIAAALLAPWAERNRALFGSPVLVSANFGANLWMGNNALSDGGYQRLPDGLPNNEVERDAQLKNEALDYIRAHPIRYVELCLMRVKLSFDRESIGIVWNPKTPAHLRMPLKLLSTLFWYAVALLGVVGILTWLRARPMNLFDPLAVTLGLFGAIAILVVGMDRYHMPLDAILPLFAALAIQHLRGRAPIRAKAQPQPA